MNKNENTTLYPSDPALLNILVLTNCCFIYLMMGFFSACLNFALLFFSNLVMYMYLLCTLNLTLVALMFTAKPGSCGFSKMIATSK